MSPLVRKAPTPTKRVDPKQGVLNLWVDRQDEVNGIGMGVLGDGTPFLNQRGLARMCGVENAHIGSISAEWNENHKPRIAAIKKILSDRGVVVDAPHLEVAYRGRKMFAYVDSVCLAILEYYAFEAGKTFKPKQWLDIDGLLGAHSGK